MIEIDHIDIVTTHICNNHCKNCIDKFVNTSNEIISIKTIDEFLNKIRKVTNKKLTVLLLGGEPTFLPVKLLKQISEIVHNKGFRITMSTNGQLKERIIQVLPYFDAIQITINDNKEIEFWRPWKDKINLKLCGDSNFTMDKLQQFINLSDGFYRKSVSMYFTPDFTELCTDKEIWDLLDTLDWKRSGSYMYCFYNGVRFKKCIPNETNIIDEPTIPKLYPNGNYNKTWNNEELDDYLT